MEGQKIGGDKGLETKNVSFLTPSHVLIAGLRLLGPGFHLYCSLIPDSIGSEGLAGLLFPPHPAAVYSVTLFTLLTG